MFISFSMGFEICTFFSVIVTVLMCMNSINKKNPSECCLADLRKPPLQTQDSDSVRDPSLKTNETNSHTFSYALHLL